MNAATSHQSVTLNEITSALDDELAIRDIPDYPGAVNGLQVSNSGEVSRIAVAVDASLAAIKSAAEQGANLLVVHHGLFWSGVQPLVGVIHEKYRLLFRHNIAVYSAHLPLDLHIQLGNNALLAQELGLAADGRFARFQNVEIGLTGTADESTAAVVERVRKFATKYNSNVRTSVPVHGRRTRRWAICTGGGASSETLREARDKGVDTLIVGEGPHHTTVEAIEHDLCVVYAGHYATETHGVQALGEWIHSRWHIPWTFLHLPTGS